MSKLLIFCNLIAGEIFLFYWVESEDKFYDIGLWFARPNWFFHSTLSVPLIRGHLWYCFNWVVFTTTFGQSGLYSGIYCIWRQNAIRIINKCVKVSRCQTFFSQISTSLIVCEIKLHSVYWHVGKYIHFKGRQI